MKTKEQAPPAPSGDEILRRMLSTPPAPHKAKAPVAPTKKQPKGGANGRA